MDKRTVNKIYTRLEKAFCLKKGIFIRNTQMLFDVEKASADKSSEKIANDFTELFSALERKMDIDHFHIIIDKRFNAGMKARLEKDLGISLPDNYEVFKPKMEEKVKLNKKEAEEEFEIIKTLRPIDGTFSVHYGIVFVKTFMKWIIESNQGINIDLEKFMKLEKADYRLIPIYQLLYYLLKVEKENVQEFAEELYVVQRLIRDCIKKIVDNVKTKNEEITNDILEVFQIYTETILFVNMQYQKKADPDDKDIPYALSFINYCLANAFIGNESRNNPMVLAFAKKGLNIIHPYFKQDAFLNLGYWASYIDLQLAYDAYYSWLKCDAVGEIAKHELYTIMPGFDKSDMRWRTTSAAQKMEAIIHNNFATVCSMIGDKYELGSIERRKFYKIAKEEIALAIQIRKNAIKEKTLDAIACDFYGNYGDILSAPSTQTIPKENAFKRALEQYDLYLDTSRKHNAINDIANAIDHISLVIMDLLYYSFLGYALAASPTQYKSIYNDWMRANEESISNYMERLKELSTEFEKTGSVFPGNVNEYEQIKKHYLEIKDLINMLNQFSNDKDAFRIVLLVILLRRTAWHIRSRLCRLEYTKKTYYTRKAENEETAIDETNNTVIAYYTTLQTAKFLFDELFMGPDDLCPRKPEKAEKGKGKNCLTVVHAKYMNDPYEGMPLLEALEPISKSPNLFPVNSSTCLRDEIYKDTFVFLKSFTDQTDSLIMWNRYASDRSDKAKGNDSNGCCVQFDPEMFNNIIYSRPTYDNGSKENNDPLKEENDDLDQTNEAKKTLISEVNDDYHLYRMVYLAKDGSINRKKNDKLLESVYQCYDALRNILAPCLGHCIDEYFSKKTNEAFKKEIKNSLRQSLQFMIFLFKSDDYSDENESRLIFLRDFDQQDTLTLLPTEPAKIAINPYQQIYIKRIIFGPNVRDNEEWEPFFQYSLNKMWKKYAEETGDTSVPLCERYSIEKSSIHYHN